MNKKERLEHLDWVKTYTENYEILIITPIKHTGKAEHVRVYVVDKHNNKQKITRSLAYATEFKYIESTDCLTIPNYTVSFFAKKINDINPKIRLIWL